MKKIITVLLMMAVLMCGCGEGKKQETQKEVSNLYEMEELVTVELDDVEFKIPKKWEENSKKVMYDVFYEDDGLTFAPRSENYNGTSEEFIEEFDKYIEKHTNEESEVKERTKEIVDIAGIKAVDSYSYEILNDSELCSNTLFFVYNSRVYRMEFVMYKDCDIDYSKDWESLKNNISLKEIQVEKETESEDEREGDIENVEQQEDSEENKEIENIEENKKENLLNEKYEFDGGEISMSLSKDKEDEYYFSINIYSDIEWKAAYAYTVYSAVENQEEMSKFNPSIIMICNDVMVSNIMSMKTAENEETEIINGTKWAVDTLTNAIAEKVYTEDEFNEFSKQLQGFIEDFMSK